MKLCSEENIVLHIAGAPVDDDNILLIPEIKEIESAGKAMISSFFHNERDEYYAFKSADIVWLGYIGGNYGSSGVLYQAGSIGVPVIATDRGLIGWLVNKYGIGELVNPQDIVSIAQAISSLCRKDLNYQLYSENITKLANRHTTKIFGSMIIEFIA